MKIVLLFEGTENESDKNPSAISELKYKYSIKDGIRVKSGECLVNGISNDHSAAGVWYLLRMPMFPYVVVKVEKLEYRPKNPVIKSLTLQQGMQDLLDPQKQDEVWAPVLDSDRRRARLELLEFYRIIFSRYMHGYKSAYKELVQNGVHSNVWRDEVRAAHDYFVPRLWMCLFSSEGSLT